MLDTIKSNEEISRIFSNGQRLSNKYLSIIFVEKGRLANSSHEHDHNGRVAFIAGKKHGGAVWRNSAKRRLREIYRLVKEESEQYDVLLIAKSTIMQASFSDVLDSYMHTLKRINNDR